MIKLLLIDDHQVLLDSLRLLFKSIENVEVVGVLNDSRKVLQFVDNQEIVNLNNENKAA